MRILNIMIGMALLPVWVLCGASGPAAHAEMEKIHDRTITREVSQELYQDVSVSSHLIDVETREGVVTLSGSVDNIMARDRAADIAGRIRGVRSVVNRIRVRPVDRGDSEIRTDIKTALLLDPATETYDVRVSVDNGVVTLKGKVHSWAEKELVKEVAKGVKGVRGVRSEIDIEYSKDRPDDELKAEIEGKLDSAIYVRDWLIDVTVDNGNVELTGSVASAAEKTRAKALSWIIGVRSVNAEQLEVVPVLRKRDLRRKKIKIRSDKEIRRAVRDALVQDPRVHKFKVDVKVDDGVVTLDGLVDNPKAKQAAQEDASNTAGVFGVNNGIKVRPGGGARDQVIEENVLRAIRWDPYLERYEIIVVVRNRKVYLNGMVDNYYEKLRAENIASRVSGVAEVRNSLEVSYVWPYKSDDEIKRAVRNRFYWNVFVDAEDVELRVEDGTVTLSGEVADRAEMMSAVRSAFEGGAKRVINRLTIRGKEGKEAEIYTESYYYRLSGGSYL